MVRMFRGRWAAAGVFFACPGVALACRGWTFAPPVFWEASDFGRALRRSAPAEPFVAFSSTFVSPQIPGQVASPAPAASEGVPDGSDTGFRRSLERFWTEEAFPTHLDGARIDVSGVTSEMEGYSDVVLAFEQAVEAHARWLTPTVDEDAQPSIADDPSATGGRETRFPLTGEVWEMATPSEDLAAAQRWMNDAASKVASSRLVVTNLAPGRLVFTGPSWTTESKSPIEFYGLDSRRPTETVERIWPTRPIVATLVVSYRRTGCRSLQPSGEPLVHRFPLALMTSEP